MLASVLVSLIQTAGPAAGARSRSRSRRCSRAFATSATTRWCSARSRSICSPCCSAASPRCCRSMPRTCWRPGPWGLGPAALGAGDRRAGDLDRGSRIISSSGASAMCCSPSVAAVRRSRRSCSRSRPRSCCRSLALAVYGAARCGQRRDPPFAGADADAERDARPRHGGQLHVHRHVRHARRIPRRRGGGAVRRVHLGAGRRHRRARRAVWMRLLSDRRSANSRPRIESRPAARSS